MSSVESVPSSLKQLRACLLCSLVICFSFYRASFVVVLSDDEETKTTSKTFCFDAFVLAMPLLNCLSGSTCVCFKFRSSQEGSLRVMDVTTVNRYFCNNFIL